MYTHRSTVPFPVLAILLFTSASSLANVKCGDTISTPTVLDQDLNCAVSPALSIMGPGGSLNMNKHTVSCRTQSDTDENIGIVLTGHGARLTDGIISGYYIGVKVSGNGKHKVTHMKANSKALMDSKAGFMVMSNNNELGYNLSLTDDAEDGNSNIGFYIEGSNNRFHHNKATDNGRNGFNLDSSSNNNRLYSNHANNNGNDGFNINGSNSNMFIRNHAEGNGGDGFDIDTHNSKGGNENSFWFNVANNNKDDGFDISGDSNKFLSNVANNNKDDGFDINSDGNKFRLNVAHYNDSDGFDVNGGSHNIFTHNHAKGNGSDGFDVDSSNGKDGNKNNFLLNIADNNKDDGFDISSNDNELRLNVANYNGAGTSETPDNGFFIDGDRNKIVFNSATGNLNNGILLINGKHNKIENNLIKKNKTNGIFIMKDAVSNDIKQNVALNNPEGDLFDENECGMNTWEYNIINMANKDCIK